MSEAPHDPDATTTEPAAEAPVDARGEAPAGDRDAARRPRRVLLGAVLVLVAWFAVGGLGGAAQGKLSGVQSNDNSTFLPANAESTLVSQAVARFSDSTELPYLVVVERRDGGTLAPADLAAVQDFAKAVPDLPLDALGAGRTLGDYLVDGSPVTPIPAQDGKAVLVSVPLDGTKGTAAAGDTTALAEGATALRDEIDRVLTPAGLSAYVGGPGGLIADFSAAFAGIDGILLGVALLVVLVILLVVYRSPILPFAVLISAVFGLSAASLVVYQLAKSDVITLSGQSQGILFILVVGAATDYALLLVSRFKEALHDEVNSWVALKRAWRSAVEPVGASAATVILSLLCLLLAELRSTSGLGPVGALGIAGAFLASLTFLPAVLLLFGRKAFWPFAPKLDHEHAEDAVESASGLWGRVARLVGTHPRRTWGLTLIALLAAAAFVPTFKAGGATIEETFLTQVDSITAQEVIGRHFPGGAAQPLQVVVPEADAQAALQVVTDDPGIESAYLGLTPPRDGQPAPPKVVDGTVLLQATTKDAADSQGAEDTVTAAAQRARPGEHRRARRGQRGDQPRRPRRQLAGPAGHRADDPRGDLRRPGAAPALPARPAGARGRQRRVLRGDHRHLRPRLRPRPRVQRRRPVDPVVRLRVPRRARHRLLDLPHDPGPRGVAGAGHPYGRARRASP